MIPAMPHISDSSEDGESHGNNRRQTREASVRWSIDQKSKKKIKVFFRSADVSSDRPFWTLI